MSDRVLLTGISGFLGGHVALQLLNAGYTVRGSVRNLSRADKVRSTLARAGADVSRLEFVTLDLLTDHGWTDAARDCRYLQHTASPFVLQQPRDKMELIRPAVEGTERALQAALVQSGLLRQGSSSGGSGTTSTPAPDTPPPTGTQGKYLKCLQDAGEDLAKIQRCAGILEK